MFSVGVFVLVPVVAELATLPAVLIVANLESAIAAAGSMSTLTINDYRHTLQTKEQKRINQNVIRSYKHQLFSETINKVALNCFDDKRYICDDNINTYSFGHKDIRNKI